VFIVHALPRSRTAWMSAFLSYGEWQCGHELSVTMRSWEDVEKLLRREKFGTVETGVSPAWSLIDMTFPDVRHAVVFRPVEDVVESCRALDISAVATYDFDLLRRNLRYFERSLQRIARQPGVLAMDHTKLDSEDGCRRLFEYCLPYEFDRDWWQSLRHRDIQVDVVEYLRYYHQHWSEIDALKRECRSVLRRIARENSNREGA